MMVVTKDALDRIKQTQRMDAAAAAAVETDVTALLQGKSYEHLAQLQRQIQAKLGSGEPVDTDYWEGLLKKLLVFKAKVSFRDYRKTGVDVNNVARPSSALCTKLWSATVSNSFENGNETRLSRPRRSCWRESRSQLNGGRLASSLQMSLQKKKLRNKSNRMTVR